MADTRDRVRCNRCGTYRDRVPGRGRCLWCKDRIRWLVKDGRYEVPLATVRRLVELRRRASYGLPLFGGTPLPR